MLIFIICMLLNFISYDKKVEVPTSVCCLNVQFLRYKAISVANSITPQDIDVLALTEMWLGTDSVQLIINKLIPTGYESNRISRNGGKYGGDIGVLYRSGRSVMVTKSKIKGT